MSEDKKNCHKVKADVIETGAIQLVDENGKMRAEVVCSPDEQSNDGFVVFHLYDGKGRPRLSLQVSDNEGASVSILNGSGSPCVSLGVFEGRGNGVTVCDNEGKPRFHVGTNVENVESASEQYVEAEMRDSAGQVIWSQTD